MMNKFTLLFVISTFSLSACTHLHRPDYVEKKNWIGKPVVEYVQHLENRQYQCNVQNMKQVVNGVAVDNTAKVYCHLTTCLAQESTQEYTFNIFFDTNTQIITDINIIRYGTEDYCSKKKQQGYKYKNAFYPFTGNYDF